jgi:hypothetical protein
VFQILGTESIPPKSSQKITNSKVTGRPDWKAAPEALECGSDKLRSCPGISGEDQSSDMIRPPTEYYELD